MVTLAPRRLAFFTPETSRRLTGTPTAAFGTRAARILRGVSSGVTHGLPRPRIRSEFGGGVIAEPASVKVRRTASPPKSTRSIEGEKKQSKGGRAPRLATLLFKDVGETLLGASVRRPMARAATNLLGS